MIRHQQGGDFLLITQDDHARLSGRMAEHLGNERFATPVPRKQVIDGIALHDCGWPVHDEQPTLNTDGLPLHVLESPMPIATRVWSESARRASEADPYTGLLVSLHVLALSAFAKRHDDTPHERYQNAHDLFLLNQFQQDQIELQDELRRRLGMRTDIPLRLGLAQNEPGSKDEREQFLTFHYNLLKMMDRLSLDACCNEPLFPKIEGVFPRPGADPVDVRLEHPGEGHLAIDVWPFGMTELRFEINCRRVPGRRYADEAEFREVYRRAPVEPFSVRISRS
jgi:hypothetical protein